MASGSTMLRRETGASRRSTKIPCATVQPQLQAHVLHLSSVLRSSSQRQRMVKQVAPGQALHGKPRLHTETKPVTAGDPHSSPRTQTALHWTCAAAPCPHLQ